MDLIRLKHMMHTSIINFPFVTSFMGTNSMADILALLLNFVDIRTNPLVSESSSSE